jgi:hypothetical protein
LYQLSTGLRTQITNNTVDDYVYDMSPNHILSGTGNNTNNVNLYQISDGKTTTLIEGLTLSYTFRDGNYLGLVDNGNVVIEVPWGRDMYLFPAATTVCSENLVTNGSFEDGLNGWEAQNVTGDKVLCRSVKGKGIYYHQDCGLRLKGAQGENSRFKQTIDLTGTTLGSGAALQVGAWYASNMHPKGFVRFEVKYADGTSSRVKFNFADYGKGAYRMMEDELALTGDATELVITIRHRSTTKTMTVDQVFAIVKPSLPASDPNPNSSPLIPLPPVALPESELGSR